MYMNNLITNINFKIKDNTIKCEFLINGLTYEAKVTDVKNVKNELKNAIDEIFDTQLKKITENGRT